MNIHKEGLVTSKTAGLLLTVSNCGFGVVVDKKNDHHGTDIKQHWPYSYDTLMGFFGTDKEA